MNGETALEFVLTNGKLILIDFAPIENVKIIKTFEKVGLKSGRILAKPPSEEVLADRWVRGYRSNFDYIMQLNFLAGLTINGTSPLYLPGDLDLTFELLLIENDFETAYRRRKFFESPTITKEIPTFADLHFGHKLKEGSNRRILFEKSHPRKCPNREEWTKSEMRQILRGTSITFCSLISSHVKRTTLNIINFEGDSIRVEIDASPNLRVSQESICKLELNNPVFSSYKKNVFVYDRKKMSLNRLHNAVKIGICQLFSETNIAVCCDSDAILFCPTQTAVEIRWFDNVRKSLCFTESPIVKLVINPGFKMFALATLDGKVRCIH
jgi:hypothetical protein